MMNRQRRLVASVLSLVAVAPGSARADDCVTSRPVIVISTKVKPPDQIIADALRDHLRASLNARGIALCTDAARTRDPVGFVLLEIRRPAEAPGPITARIVVGDEITDKRVERTMDLTDVPKDARPMAVSTSGDELLRASWAELMIADAPPLKKAPPGVVVEAVAGSLRSEEELLALAPPEPVPDPGVQKHAVEVGLLGHAAVFAHLETFGGDLQLGYWFEEQLHAYARGRFSFSTSQSGFGGSVHQRTQGAALGVGYAFLPVRRRLSVAAEIDLSAHRVELLPSRQTDAVVEQAANDWTVETTFGPRGYLTFAPFQLSLGVAMRVAIRPTRATEGGEVLLSNDRIGGEATFGIHLLL